MTRVFRAAFPVCLGLLLPAVSHPALAAEPLIISAETTWEGTVTLDDDVLVTETGTLRVRPGTRVLVQPSEGTRTDPAFFFTDTELTVRGKLIAEADGGAPIEFLAAGNDTAARWAGITVEGPGASATLSGVTVSGAVAGVTVIDASASLSGVTLTGCRYGALLLGTAAAVFDDCRVTGNDYGIADYSGGAKLNGTAPGNNAEADLLGPSRLEEAPTGPWWRLPYRRRGTGPQVEFLGEHSIAGDTVWSGRVVIRGQVVVQPGATLTVQPGTEVAFRRLDTNGDGLGESLLLVLGGLRVLGTPENWVLFTSAEETKRPGDWDKVSLIASDSPGNLVRHARFEYGYQAFHNHFSAVELEAVAFNDNYRGVQFQESRDTVIRGALFTGNKSAMRFRDSTVTISDALVDGNLSGINFLRCQSVISDTVISGSLLDPLLGRESQTTLHAVIIAGNREGPRFKGEGSTLDMSLCAVGNNLEDGLSLAGTNARISRSLLSGNGFDGVSVTGGTLVIADTSLAGNGRWALDNNGEAGVDARSVYWGPGSDEAVEDLIWDKRDEPALGRVLWRPRLMVSPGLLFAGLPSPVEVLEGTVSVVGDVRWEPGHPLAAAPGTLVRFEPLSGHSPLDTLRDHPNFRGPELIVSGSAVTATGTIEAPIRFEGAGGGRLHPSWGAVNLEGCEAAFSRCLFRGADSALHLRDSAGSIESCRFQDNAIGLRFNSSRLTVRGNVFSGNGTGLRFHFGEPEVTGNLFEGNLRAVFLSRDPGRFLITGNDFLDSGEYALSLGEEAAGEIDVSGNWWGTGDPERLEELFFHAGDDPHLGRVIPQPVATGRLTNPDAPAPPD